MCLLPGIVSLVHELLVGCLTSSVGGLDCQRGAGIVSWLSAIVSLVRGIVSWMSGIVSWFMDHQLVSGFCQLGFQICHLGGQGWFLRPGKHTAARDLQESAPEATVGLQPLSLLSPANPMLPMASLTSRSMLHNPTS